jgi:tetratricopeptide (TPR) repeat protein
MLNLDLDIRPEVWNLVDWSSSVPALGLSLLDNADLPPLRKAALLRQLAELCEFCVLDPQSAADLYSASYQQDRSQLNILARMRRLCHSMGREDHAARTAELEFRHSSDPRFHAIAGQAWLDAGMPDRALKPLVRAQEQDPENLELAACLEVARRDWASPEVKANTLLLEAEQTSEASPRLALQAARILRMLDVEDERYEAALRISLSQDPNLPSACHLTEHFLFSTDRLEELANHFRRRAQSAPSHEVAARILFQGSSLLFRADEGSEGGPLFFDGLTMALDAKLRSIPGLLAQLRGLVASAPVHRKQVIEIAEQAYAMLASADERVGVAIFCAKICWHAQKDRDKARTWIERLRVHTQDHPLLREYDAN